MSWNPLHELWLDVEKRDLSEAVGAHQLRRRACNRWSWAIPSPKAVERLVDLSPIVEVAAGTGYWARVLTDAGADVVAYDRSIPALDPTVDDENPRAKESSANQWHPNATPWFEVIERDGVEAAAAHPDRTLLLCWPPYADDLAADVLRAFVAAGGKRVVYIGEGPGGCTADDEFHALLGMELYCSPCSWPESPDEHRCGIVPLAEVEERLALPQWYGIHDELYVAVVGEW